MIPTQLFFDAKGKEVKRHVGFMDKAAIVFELKAAGLK
jgi:thioredoxin 1